MQYVNRYTSSIGNITMASDGEALTGLWFDGQKYFGLYLDNENEEKDLKRIKKKSFYWYKDVINSNGENL